MIRETANVSVVIPCYNCSSTIERAIESVKAQTLLPKEVILVEDCSQDNTLAVLNRLKHQSPDGWIKVLSLSENIGAGGARNAGWDIATQRYICFLDSDDAWHPLKIEIQYAWMTDNPKVALTGHAYRQIRPSELPVFTKVELHNNLSFSEVSPYNLLFSNRFSTPSVMIKADLPFRFEEGKRYAEDYLLWLQVALSGYKCFRSELKLFFMFKSSYGEAGLSSHLWRMERGELSAYRSLFRDGHISFFLFFMVGVTSFLKFVKRTVGNVFRGI
ncbi:MAG: glycosyltransferase family 2 protein [Alkalibacterium sp.]|nr:glycosyltransferase family 2 protein [Alkalibacterium sp.]